MHQKTLWNRKDFLSTCSFLSHLNPAACVSACKQLFRVKPLRSLLEGKTLVIHFSMLRIGGKIKKSWFFRMILNSMWSLASKNRSLKQDPWKAFFSIDLLLSVAGFRDSYLQLRLFVQTMGKWTYSHITTTIQGQATFTFVLICFFSLSQSVT